MWKTFHLSRMFQFMWFWILFWKWNMFHPKWKNSAFSIPNEAGRPDEEKIFLPKWKVFHLKWKSCSTPRASLARAVFKLFFF